MEIKTAFYRLGNKNYPYLEINFEDGRSAKINSEQRRVLDPGLVYLGYDFEDDPALEAIFTPPGGTPVSWRGMTDDLDVLRLTIEFLDSLDDETFEAGRQVR